MARKKQHHRQTQPKYVPTRMFEDDDNQPQESLHKVKPTDLKNVIPITKNQELFFNSYNRDKFLSYILYGSAGTGKTYIAVYNALREVLDPSTPFKRVVIVRSAVPSRDIGHLPGNEKEKTEVYLQPYREIAAELFPKFGEKAYMKLKEQGYVDFLITSFVRGLTLDNCIVILDEFQNAGWHELNTVVTRVGKNCKLILCGDIRQNDLNKKHDPSGFQKLMTIATHMEDTFDIIEFDENDICRSKFVKSWICAINKCEDLNLI
jgi:predicted ribonuclease YlaK